MTPENLQCKNIIITLREDTTWANKKEREEGVQFVSKGFFGPICADAEELQKAEI
jgi:hypothetical protein